MSDLGATLDWLFRTLPVGGLVPDQYQRWRPVVSDSLEFIVSRMSPGRLAGKLAEQLQLPTDTPPEVRLLRLIQKMPGLQKLGQVLARNRHLSPQLRESLSRLENSISDATFDEIHGVIEAKLGPLLAEWNVQIEAEIFSEASVSAVVRFTCRHPETGETERGVFKVLKPHIPECFAEDMELFRQLGEFLAERSDNYGLPASSVAETLAEVRELLEHELNFPREQAMLQRSHRVRVPRLIPQLSNAQITAMTEEQGVKITDAFPNSPAERTRVAMEAIEALLVSPMFSQENQAVFHADPHAGNLLYDEEANELIVLDWALTETLSREQRRHMIVLMIMLALRDVPGVCAAITAIADEITESVHDSVKHLLAGIPYWRIPGTLEAMLLLDDLALRGVRFPASLLMFRKSIFTLDGVIHEIAGPGFSIDAAIARTAAFRWLPLLPSDWLAVQWSALFYPNRQLNILRAAL